MSDEQLPTTEKLARAIEALNDPKMADMAQKARAGYYDEYKTEQLLFPLKQLHADFLARGYPDMARQVIDGEWDATREEGQAWFDSEPEDGLKQVFRTLAKGK